MTERLRVLVTDGEQRSALAMVRSYGKAGFEPFVCSAERRSLAGGSRYAVSEAVVPDPLHEPGAFAASVHGLVDTWNVDVVVPVTEAALLSVLEQRDRFQNILMPFPDIETFASICDKARVLDVARHIGIETPRQFVVPTRDAVDAIPHEGLKFPVVLKPAKSVSGFDAHGRIKVGVRYADDYRSLIGGLRDLPPAAFPVMIQERIVGPGVGVFLLVWDGELKAFFGHRRLREKPPSGGVSVYRESIKVEQALLDRSLALLRAFSWNGVAMVEYKVDRATGTPYLMEVNGRFWGSLQLAIDAGVDFPVYLVRVARGEPVPKAGQYKVGIRSRWWWGDVDQLIAQFKRGPALELPADAPSLVRSFLEFMVFWRPGDRNEVFRFNDPRPSLRETAKWFSDILTFRAKD